MSVLLLQVIGSFYKKHNSKYQCQNWSPRPALPALVLAKQKSLGKSAISSWAIPQPRPAPLNRAPTNQKPPLAAAGVWRHGARTNQRPGLAPGTCRPRPLAPRQSLLSAFENLPGWCFERELSISLKVFIAYLLGSNLLFALYTDNFS